MKSKRGSECGCFCLNCGEPLLARKGQEVRHHFAHFSYGGCGGGGPESALHKAAKTALVASKDKGIALGVSGHRCLLVESELEVTLPNSRRQVDVMATIAYKQSGPGTLYRATTLYTGALCIEIAVSNPKDRQYAGELVDLGIPAYEKAITLDDVLDFQDRRGCSLVSALKACLLSRTTGRWLSVAGLPLRIAAHADRYEGPPHAVLDIASRFLKDGDVDMCRLTLLRVAHRRGTLGLG